MTMLRGAVLISLSVVTCTLAAARPVVSTAIGTGTPGYADQQVNTPYGVEVGPDGALYFCDLDNQRVRRLDLKTGQTTTIAGNGKRVSTFAGTGVPGFAGDGGPATRAQLLQPHSIAFDPQGRLLICDIGNHRIRRVDPSSATIETYAGTGERRPTPDGAPLRGTPLNGPRTIALDPDGNLYVALREGNSLYRINPNTETIHHVAGTGEQGYWGDGGPARLAKLAGPKGLAYAPDHQLYVADTENHVIRRIDLGTGVITTVLGTGERGDGPEPDPLRCRLARPHGIFADAAGVVYVGDSEAHRIRMLQ
jgi:DNA-binding beta-propeller fold protein YncE